MIDTLRLSATPSIDPARRANKIRIVGELPSPLNPPSGCRFRTRCPRAQERCAAEEPLMREIDPGHFLACHYPLGGAPEAPPGESNFHTITFAIQRPPSKRRGSHRALAASRSSSIRPPRAMLA